MGTHSTADGAGALFRRPKRMPFGFVALGTRPTDKIAERAPDPISGARRSRHASRRHPPFLAHRGPGYFGDWLSAQALPFGLIALDEGAAVPASRRAYSGIGMMGGPMSVNDGLPWVAPVCTFLRDAIGDGVPVIGHCLGGQLMAKALGARVARAAHRKSAGSTSTYAIAVRARVVRRPARFAAFQWHYDMFDLPPMATRVLTNAFNAEPGLHHRRPAHRLAVPHRNDPRARGDVVPHWCRRAARAVERQPANRGGDPRAAART